MKRKRKLCNDHNHETKPKTLVSDASSIFKIVLQEGDVKKLEVLISRSKFDLVNDRDENELSYLHRAVLQSTSDNYVKMAPMVKYIITQDARTLRVTDKLGMTALLLACRNAKCPQVIKMLVETDPEGVDKTDRRGNTALHLLIQNAALCVNLQSRKQLPQYLEAAELLIKKSANIDIQNSDGFTALVYLIYQKSPQLLWLKEVLKLLVDNGASLYTSSGSHVLKYVNCYDVFQLILQQYPPVINVPNQDNATLLDEIVFREDYMQCSGFVKLLVTYGTISPDGPNVVSSNYYRDFSINSILLKRYPDYDINTKDFQGRTLLFRYCEDINAVKKLLSLGADPNIFDNSGQSVLNVAIAFNVKSAKIIKLLIENCSDQLLMKRTAHKNYFPVRVCESFLQLLSGYDNYAHFDVWFDVLCLIFSREIFKDLSMPPEIAAVFTAVLVRLDSALYKCDIHERFNAIPNCAYQVLKLLIDTNESVLNIKNKYKISDNLTLLLSPISYIIIENCNPYGNCRNMFLTLMLQLGFSVSDIPRDEITPLTACLLAHHGLFLVKDFKNFMKLLVNNNCNLESMCLFEKNIAYGIDKYGEEMITYKSEMYLSDALFLAVNLNVDQLYGSSAFRTMLSSWWAPPLCLLTCHRKLQVATLQELRPACEILQQLLPVLVKYGGVPHGTQMYARLMEVMEAWHTVSLQNLEFRDYFDAFYDKVLKLTASPLSLQQLCKYQVRHMFAERACESGISLPALLHQNLPPLLRELVIH